MLRQMKDLGAIGEERRAAFTKIEPAFVEFTEESEELDRCVPLIGSRPRHCSKKFSISKLCDGGFHSHNLFITRDCRAVRRRLYQAIDPLVVTNDDEVRVRAMTRGE